MASPRPITTIFADRRAGVALEAALLFPLMVILLVGFVETYFYLRAVAVIERVSFTIANTASRQTVLRDCQATAYASDLGTYMALAQRLAQPLDLATQGKVIISAVRNPGPATTSPPVVAWQRRSTYSIDDAASAVGADGGPATLPGNLTVLPVAGLQPDGLIVAEVYYRFIPFAGIRSLLPTLPGEITIERRTYMRQRNGTLNNLGAVTNCATLPH